MVLPYVVRHLHVLGSLLPGKLGLAPTSVGNYSGTVVLIIVSFSLNRIVPDIWQEQVCNRDSLAPSRFTETNPPSALHFPALFLA